jgi:hypothetical protein
MIKAVGCAGIENYGGKRRPRFSIWAVGPLLLQAKLFASIIIFANQIVISI